MEKKELIFVTMPAAGHMVSTLEFAKSLLERSQLKISITFLVMKLPFGLPTPASHHHPNIRFVELPEVDPPSLDFSKSENKFFELYVASHKSHVKDAIINLVLSKSITTIVGLVVDFLFTSMIDVANELCIPSYVFFVCNAAVLSLLRYLPHHHTQNGKELSLSGPDSIVPGFANPLPSRVLPSFLCNEDGYEPFLNHSLRYKETKGIFLNSFAELESHTIKSLTSEGETPKVYPVGPLVNLKGTTQNISGTSQEKLIKWLDDQPSASVVFLCFGSLGGFEPPQLKEIAAALERSGQRFLWCVRKPVSSDEFRAITGEYNISEVLPEGFLERTKHKGMVCDWAPQVQVLAHKAVGGFVCHCGWNSFLESLWYGVPIAAWPLQTENQINAFQLVKELELAVEVQIDYRLENSSNLLINADEIKNAITKLMDVENPVRKRVKDMSEICRKSGVEGRSSFNSMGQLIQDVLANAA